MEERWTLSVLKELVTIANRGKGVILQHEDPVQACYSCLEDLQDLQKTLAQNHLGPGVWPHAFLETFGARIEQILR